GTRHRSDQLGAVARDALAFVLASHHETRDVLQEYQRRVALAGKLDEMGSFLGAVRKQDSIVGKDADRNAVDPGKAGDQGGSEARLEFVEFAAVDDARDQLASIVGLA